MRVDGEAVSSPVEEECFVAIASRNDGIYRRIRLYPKWTDKKSKTLYRGTPVAHPTLMIKTPLLKKFRYSENTKCNEDIDLWFRMLEAMSNGCPVVSFDCPNGPSDLIENKKNGLLVENQNEEKLYEAILQMIENPDFRKICAANALKSVKKYSIENIFEDWKSLFNLVQEKK